ncbi:MAG TPA: tetratricopeptide repeat protein [Acidobacteriota bacterium]|nr:tetratricopeptide repeat protein [Acidobacteriota bacterium]
MRFSLKWMRWLFIGAWLTAGGILLVPSASGAFRYLQEGMTAPPVEGKDLLTGETVSSERTEGANVIIVAFWATWSERSLEILEDLKALVADHPDGSIRIFAVNVENQTISADMRKLIEHTVTELDLPFPVLIDDELALFFEYGVIAVPSAAIMDSTGVLRFAPSGYSYTIRDRIVDTIEVLLGLKQPTEAVALRRGYVPTNTTSRYYLLALQLVNQRMYERALANLKPALEADSLFSGPHNLRGQIYLELDRLPEAAAEFAVAVQLDSTSVAAWAGWGHALLRQGQATAARAKLAAALALDGSYTPALLDLALCLAQEQKTGEALDSLRAARELNPQDPAVHYQLGQVFHLAGQTDSTVDAYHAALKILFPAP